MFCCFAERPLVLLLTTPALLSPSLSHFELLSISVCSLPQWICLWYAYVGLLLHCFTQRKGWGSLLLLTTHWKENHLLYGETALDHCLELVVCLLQPLITYLLTHVLHNYWRGDRPALSYQLYPPCLADSFFLLHSITLASYSITTPACRDLTYFCHSHHAFLIQTSFRPLLLITDIYCSPYSHAILHPWSITLFFSHTHPSSTLSLLHCSSAMAHCHSIRLPTANSYCHFLQANSHSTCIGLLQQALSRQGNTLTQE